MERLKITDGNDELNLNRTEARVLEIRLNLHEKGRNMILIGDVLYRFHVGNKLPYSHIWVEKKDMEVLRNLMGGNERL